MIDLLYMIHQNISNVHYIKRYIKFISSRKTVHKKNETHFHHILPKAKDFFPQFKNLKENSWNSISLTYREHFIAHLLLHKAFKGTSQSIAFFNMSNFLGKVNSKSYQEAKEIQAESNKIITHSKERNKKISISLTGKPKTEEHKKKLGGPRTQSEKNAISEGVKKANFRFSEEQKLEMSISRKGRKPIITEEGVIKMTESKMSFLIQTPIGVFKTYKEAELLFGCDIRNIFRRGVLDKVPKNTRVFELLGIKNKENKTWRELGFDTIQK